MSSDAPAVTVPVAPAPPDAGRARTRRKWAILLVHGFGDTQPDCMIDEVAGAMRQVAPGWRKGAAMKSCRARPRRT